MDAVKLPGWLETLRRVEVTDRVGDDPRSRGGSVLGVDRDRAFREVIGGGQADFDAPWGRLSPDDRALLYAYFNQKGHLEELVEAFRQHFAEGHPTDPVVVDLGCGPFTGGLALAATLRDDPRFDYVGIDRANSMRRLAARLAGSRLVPGRVTCHWASDIDSLLASEQWPHPPGWREVIVIVSYLLASPALDAPALVRDLERLLGRLGAGAVTLLYTNSAREEPNRQYPDFQKALESLGFEVRVGERGEIEVERAGRPRERSLRYALFRRSRRRTLPLGG